MAEYSSQKFFQFETFLIVLVEKYTAIYKVLPKKHTINTISSFTRDSIYKFSVKEISQIAL